MLVYVFVCSIQLVDCLVVRLTCKYPIPAVWVCVFVMYLWACVQATCECVCDAIWWWPRHTFDRKRRRRRRRQRWRLTLCRHAMHRRPYREAVQTVVYVCVWLCVRVCPIVSGIINNKITVYRPPDISMRQTHIWAVAHKLCGFFWLYVDMFCFGQLWKKKLCNDKFAVSFNECLEIFLL